VPLLLFRFSKIRIQSPKAPVDRRKSLYVLEQLIAATRTSDVGEGSPNALQLQPPRPGSPDPANAYATGTDLLFI
jgi:hypothetical protein